MSVPRALDHIVVATPDLAATVAAFAAATGVAPESGGVHPQHGTRNALVSFGDGAYLELIGLDPTLQGPGVDPTVFGLDAVSREGVATFALHPGRPEEALAAAAAEGADLGALAEGARLDPAGETLRWRLTPPLHAGDPTVPFLIAWGATPSPSTTVQARAELARFAVSHPDPAAAARILGALGTDVAVERGEAGFVLAVTGPGGTWSVGAAV